MLGCSLGRGHSIFTRPSHSEQNPPPRIELWLFYFYQLEDWDENSISQATNLSRPCTTWDVDGFIGHSQEPCLI